MYRLIFLLFSLILAPVLIFETSGFSVNAQSASNGLFSVTGTVIDSVKNTIPYASVYVSLSTTPNKVHKTFVCNDAGKFEEKLPKGKYIFNFRSVGYKNTTQNLELDSSDINLGAIILRENANELGEVVVRPLIEYNAREIIYNITSDPDREKSKMMDIVSKVPFLSIINNKIVAEDDPTKSIVILRDGKKDPLFSGGVSYNDVMRYLPAMGFTQIRILLDKPEEYRDYDYVISVTSDKTQRLFGAVGQSDGSYNLNRNLSLTQAFTGSADKLRISGNFGYSLNKPVATKNTSSTTATDYSLYDINRARTETNSYSGNISLSQDIAEKQYLSGSLSISKNNSQNFNYGTSEFRSSNQPDSLTNNNTFADNVSTSFSGNIAYHYNIKPQKQTFSMSYTVNTSPSEGKQTQSIENKTFGLWNSSLRKSKGHSYSHFFSMNYRDKLTPNLTLTGRTSLLIANNDMENRKYDISSESEIEDLTVYDYFERPVHRIDGSLSLSWLASRNFNISTDIRPDYLLNTSKITMISGTNGPSYYTENNWAFRSNLNMLIIFRKKTTPVKNIPNIGLITMVSGSPAMSSSPNDNTLNFSYSISQNRPNYRFLSNYVDDTNPNYIETGNPFLKNETTHSFSVVFGNKNLLDPSLSYRFSNDRITHYWYKTSDNKTVQSYINGGQYKNINLTLRKNFLKLVRLNLSGEYTKENINDYNNEKYSVNAGANSYMTIFKNYALFGGLMYRKNFASGYSGSNFNPWYLYVNVRRDFILKNGMRLSTTAGTNNVFGWTQRVNSFVNTGAFSINRSLVSKNIPIYIGFTLNFGKFKVKPVKKAMSSGVFDGFSDELKDESETSTESKTSTN